MNARALLLLTLLATAAPALHPQQDATGSDQRINDQPTAPAIPQQPAATLPGATTPDSNRRSTTTSPLNAPAATTAPGAPIPLPPTPMRPDRADDSYAIYSLLMPGSYLLGLGPEHNQTWLVGDTTITRGYPGDRTPGAQRCIQPPADRAQDFKAVFDDYDKHKAESVQLEHNLQVQIPYKLLNEQQRNAFNDTRNASRPNAPDAATADDYRGAPGITYFSQVYFNLGNTLALVYMQESCGPKCGTGKWVALEKVSGGWVPRDWNVCSLAS